MSDNRPLAGKTAFITGGSGAIGRYSAKWLARDGANVLLMARHLDALEKTRAELQGEVPGARVEIRAGDARKVEDVQAALAAAHAIANRLDIIVPTVGGGAGFRPLLMCTVEDFRKDLEMNLVTVFIAVRYGAPMMTAGGSIVCISSTAAMMPFNGLAGYCAAKGGLESFIEAAAEESGSRQYPRQRGPSRFAALQQHRSAARRADSRQVCRADAAGAHRRTRRHRRRGPLPGGSRVIVDDRPKLRR